jgi:alkylation response protein AidB-like acyl-CoA dehydrogenase
VSIDFSLPEEISTLEGELARFASDKLGPGARDFEAAGAWDQKTLSVFDGFAVSSLDIPEDWAGAGAGLLSKVVALEAVARGDAGGLLGADALGPSAAAALSCPDRDLARRVVGECLERTARSALLLDGARADWLAGNSAPAWTWVCEPVRLLLLDTRQCKALAVEGAALHASGGISLNLEGAETVGEWPLSRDASGLVRGRARTWPAAVMLGVAEASLRYAIAYAQERVVMGTAVAHHQGNAFAIAEARGLIDAALSALHAAASRIDTSHGDGGTWATLAYIDCVEASLHATDLGVQLLGGHGYVEDHPVEKWYREARALALLLGGRLLALEDASEVVLDLRDPLLA